MTSLSHMKTIHYIGIDVSKDTLHINASDLRSSTCSNQAKALVPWLRQLPARAHLVLEASGGYEKLLATLAHRAGVPVSIVNPARVRAFAKARGQRAKTDRIDAALITDYARHLQPTPTPPMSASHARALELLRGRQALVAQRVTWINLLEHVTEADLINFVGATGMLESIFIDAHHEGGAIAGRPVPAVLTYALIEGFLVQSMIQGTGLASLELHKKVLAPVRVGDTIEATVEITGLRPTSKSGRAVVASSVDIFNQHGTMVITYEVKRLLAGRRDAPAST
jgi:acyl dehydratase